MMRMARRWLLSVLISCLAILWMSFTPSSADAQFFASDGSLSSTGELGVTSRYKKRRKYRRTAKRRRTRHYKKRKRRSRRRVSGVWQPEKAPNGPVQLIVSLPNQRVDVYRDGKHIARSRISTGKPGHRTPSGVFSIIQKQRVHYSNIYGGAPMPNMQRITWSGVALHGGPVPNYPASHGCIRLPYGFAKKLFRVTQKGAHVIVAKEKNTVPVAFSHPKLFRPVPFSKVLAALKTAGASAATYRPASGTDQSGGDATTASAASSDQAAEARRAEIAQAALQMADAETTMSRIAAYRSRSNAPLRILITRRGGRERVRDVQRILNELGYDAGPVDGDPGKLTITAIKAFQGALGMRRTGSVSEKLVGELYRISGRKEITTGQLYVRQNYRDIFDAPVIIRDPKVPLGTYVYTAMDFAKEATQTRWTALTVQKVASQKVAQLPATSDQSPIPMRTTSASRALDRIEIPENVRRRISEMLTPGSSLIVTDNGISNETTSDGSTDFIVTTR